MTVRSSIATAVALALALARSASGQATQRITGQVTDADSKYPIPAVRIAVTGTTLGALTTDSGRFTLRNVPADAKSIEIRRIGYIGATVPLVQGQTEYAVTLKQDVLHLEQEVITGVATTASSKNAVTHDPIVTGDQLNGAPTATIENALQGKVPGVQVDQNSGAPGGGLQVNVRGVTSINGNTEPLYVVDGVIVSNSTFNTGLNALTGANGVAVPMSNQDQSVNRIADLNPNDIESMQVLEGAAAASIYGSRAAAGVVVITTKKGSVAKPEIDATEKFGHYELENTLDARHFTLAQAYTLGGAVGMSAAAVKQNYNECNGFCDLQAQLYGNTQASNETDLTIRGGTPTTTYFLSGLSKYDNGAEINTGYNKQSVRASVNQTMFSAISVAANLSYTSSLTRTGINGNDNLGVSGYDVLAYTPSFFCMSCHAANGQYVFNPFGQANAFQDASLMQTPDEVNRTTLGGTATWKLFTATKQSLEIAAVGGADFVNERTQFYAPPNLQVQHSSLIQLPGTSTSGQSYDRLNNWSVSLIHTWTPSTLLSATTSIGITRDKDATYQNMDLGNGLVTNAYAYTNAAQIIPFYQQTESNDAGYYAQEQLLLFDERLSLTGGVNAERSSNNGAINKFYPYPKVAGSYRILTGNTELKVRAAYGQAGTLPIYGVKFDSTLTQNYNSISGTGFAATLGDPNVRPETNTSIETGVDLTAFKGRMALNATVFQKRVTNLLLKETVLPSAGYIFGWTNGGQLTNQGLELSFNATPVQTGKFSWSTTEQYSRVYDRVDNLPIPPFPAGNSFGDFPFGGYHIIPGASANAIYGYPTNKNDLEQMGNAAPALMLGFGNDLSYGPLHLHAFFDWREGMSVDNLTQQYWDFAFSGTGIQGNLADTAGTNARIAAYDKKLTAYVYHASFLKLRELTAKWDLPHNLVSGVGQGYLRHASLVLTGRNLVTWTKYPGLDPEVSNFGTQQFGRGQDVTPFPPTRSYFMSLELGF
ncbi:MAG TPA: TonB-dependent receptor [Gemmatimonadaceae bacterium]|nr:TonB-dependent receptor [Gemmatimonadaceae bacterium]